MKIITNVACSRNQHSQQLHFSQDVETNLQENSTLVFVQNEELSSIGEDSQQIKETSLSPVHCSNLDDIQVALKSGAKDLEIPDDVYRELIEAAEKGGHSDNPGEMGQNGDIVLERYKPIDLSIIEDDT